MVALIQSNVMAMANGKNSNVVGDCPDSAPRGRNSAGQGSEEVGNKRHAKWASLGDGTTVPGDDPKLSCNSFALV